MYAPWWDSLSEKHHRRIVDRAALRLIVVYASTAAPHPTSSSMQCPLLCMFPSLSVVKLCFTYRLRLVRQSMEPANTLAGLALLLVCHSSNVVESTITVVCSYFVVLHRVSGDRFSAMVDRLRLRNLKNKRRAKLGNKRAISGQQYATCLRIIP